MINTYHQWEPSLGRANPFGLFLPETAVDETINGKYLLWVDLEATSLNTDTATCLEIGAVLTSLDAKTIYGRGFTSVRQAPEAYEQIDEWVSTNIPKAIDDSMCASASVAKVDQWLNMWLDVIIRANSMTAPTFHLAGNSVWYDRAIIRHQFPKLHERLHYRQLDVSSIQIFMDAAHPTNPDTRLNMEKKKSHRAVKDIDESITQYARFLDFSQNPSKML